jgi:nucleoside 2-deoxyribosyltransferase
MEVPVRLKKIELDVLAAMHSYSVYSTEDVVAVLHLTRRTEGDFGRLLKEVVAAGKLSLARPLKDGVEHRTLRPEVERAIDALAAKEHLRKTPVYRDLPVPGQKPAQALIRYELSLTAEGTRIAEAYIGGRRLMMRSPLTDQRSVFVACAVKRPELDLLFAEELEPACAALGLEAYRVDAVEPAATIMDELIQGIRRARIMVADLTHARPSVYFEVGVAHGMGVPFVLTCRSDHDPGSADDQRVHFDLKQFKISYWTLREGVFSWEPGMRPSLRMRALLKGS